MPRQPSNLHRTLRYAPLAAAVAFCILSYICQSQPHWITLWKSRSTTWYLSLAPGELRLIPIDNDKAFIAILATNNWDIQRVVEMETAINRRPCPYSSYPSITLPVPRITPPWPRGTTY